MKTIVCKHCGKIVEQTAINQKYCLDCRAEAYRKSVKRWRWNNPERCAKRKRKYYLEHADELRKYQRQYRLRGRKEQSP